METKNQMKQPFFAKFLEGQTNQNDVNSQDRTQQSSTANIFEGIAVTLKFPSDSDEELL